MGVLGDAYEGLTPINTVFLHVWGDGIDGRIRVGDSPRDAVFLAYEPKNSHGEYFAQLEDTTRQPRSPAYEITTFANDGTGCPRNQIHLRFYSGER
jgi:hypothetical protein